MAQIDKKLRSLKQSSGAGGNGASVNGVSNTGLQIENLKKATGAIRQRYARVIVY